MKLARAYRIDRVAGILHTSISIAPSSFRFFWTDRWLPNGSGRRGAVPMRVWSNGARICFLKETLQCATKGAGVQRMKDPLGKLSVQLYSYRASQRSNPRRGSLGRKGSEGLSSESAGRNASES